MNKSEKPNKKASKMNKGKKTFGKFIVTSSNSAVTLELLKETFHEMTFLILFFTKEKENFAIATGG